MAAQFLTTSRLSNIINMISLGQQSGILRVIRGQGPTREIGQIKFMEGQPVTALLGQLTGPNALTVLSNWGECIYSFDEHALNGSDGDPSFGSSGPHISSEPGRYSPSMGNQSGSWPSQGYPSNYPQSQSPFSGPLGNGQPSFATMPGANSMPGYGGMTNGYGGQPQRFDTNPDTSAGYAPAYQNNGTAQLPPSMLMTIPQRTVMAEHVDQLPLDRRERMLLLLVDNRRTLSDLARLTRRNEREVLSVLEHLSTLGLVQVNA
jgi:hypothetical protein